MALAGAVSWVAPRIDIRAGAIVVDHGLQAGSDEVAARAAEQCRSLGLDPVLVVRAECDATGVGPEAQARVARYQVFEHEARTLGAEVVLLAHTLDDQAETVLLRLARGSGARSLSGIPAQRGIFRRPLLTMRRQEMIAIVEESGLTTWSDPHNSDAAYARSRVRHNSMPSLINDLGDGVVMGLARSARLLGADADALDGWALSAANELMVRDADAIVLEVEPLAALPEAIRTRVIRAAAIELGSPEDALNAELLWEVDRLLTHWHGQGPIDLPRVQATRSSGRLSLTPRKDPSGVRTKERKA